MLDHLSFQPGSSRSLFCGSPALKRGYVVAFAAFVAVTVLGISDLTAGSGVQQSYETVNRAAKSDRLPPLAPKFNPNAAHQHHHTNVPHETAANWRLPIGCNHWLVRSRTLACRTPPAAACRSRSIARMDQRTDWSIVMNSSLATADLGTHVKIVIVSLIAATVVMAASISARVSGPAAGNAPVNTASPPPGAKRPTLL